MIWIRIASIFMFLGVALGAFGAHALREKMTNENKEVYKTAVFYHFIHALSLFVVAWLSTQTVDPKVTLAGIFLTVGIILFSGSLYVFTMAHIRWLGWVTPLGGLSFLVGWILVLVSTYDQIK